MNSVERNRGRNNYFTCCFRPADTDEGSVKRRPKDCPGGPPVLAISVQGGDKMVLPKILTSLSEDKSKVSPDGGGVERRRGLAGAFLGHSNQYCLRTRWLVFRIHIYLCFLALVNYTMKLYSRPTLWVFLDESELFNRALFMQVKNRD